METRKTILNTPASELFVLLASCLLVVQGCTDLGSAPPSDIPVIQSISPSAAAAGDTITIIGSRFGDVQGSGVVRIGGVVADTIILWSPSQIKVRIPAASTNGSVVVSISGARSNTFAFQLNAIVPPVSFSADVVPIFIQHGCYECHGGSGGLIVHTVADLLRGGQDGPAIVPGNADGSLIMKKLLPTPPFGSRMPEGGPYLDSATIAVIRTWINQGAANN